MLKRRVSLRVNFYARRGHPRLVPARSRGAGPAGSSGHPARLRRRASSAIWPSGSATGSRARACRRRCTGARGRFPTVHTLARDLLSALEHAHLHGIIVRRIVPASVLVSTARPRRRSPTSASAATPCPPIPPGTVPDLADVHGARGPRRRCRRPASDVYTAGALLYFAVTGQEPPLDPRAASPAHRAPARPAPARSSGSSCGRCSRPRTTATSPRRRCWRTSPRTPAPSRPAPSRVGQGRLADAEDSARWEKRLRRALGDDYELLGAARHRRVRPGVPGAGPAPRARGGAQGAAPAADPGSRGGRALPARGAARGRPQPPEHRQHLRYRRAVGPHLVHHGADRRAEPGPAGRARRPAPAGPRCSGCCARRSRRWPTPTARDWSTATSSRRTC